MGANDGRVNEHPAQRVDSSGGWTEAGTAWVEVRPPDEVKNSGSREEIAARVRLTTEGGPTASCRGADYEVLSHHRSELIGRGDLDT